MTLVEISSNILVVLTIFLYSGAAGEDVFYVSAAGDFLCSLKIQKLITRFFCGGGTKTCRISRVSHVALFIFENI